MKTYFEPGRETRIYDEVDVLVVGGGSSGISAAVGAAKQGAKTMIIERLGSFGGMWTNGMVITLAGFNSWLKPYQRCVDGVVGEWIRRATELGGAEDNRSWVLNSDPEVMKLVADQLVREYGILCLLHTLMADVIKEGDQVKGVIIENVSGRFAILAKRVVDATGNGDVLARANGSFEISHQLQPMTMPFYINDVIPKLELPHDNEVVIPIGPEPGLLKDPYLTQYASRRHDIDIDHQKLASAKKEGELPTFGGPWFGGLRKNQVWVNTTRVYGSAVDAGDLTKAEMQARQDAHTILDFYREEMEGFEKAYLAQTSPVIGVRETRRLTGLYTLTGDDVRSQTSFEDSIGLGVWPIDVHPSQGQSGVHAMYVPAPYDIPYRCLLPMDVENLLVSGRCVSMDREAHGSARVGATCGVIGHAAGVAAALSIQLDQASSKLPYTQLREALLAQGALLDVPK